MEAISKPVLIPDNIPAELKSLSQWVLWRYEKRKEKITKVPYQVNGRKAESDNPDTWTSFDSIMARFLLPGYDGVGVMQYNGLAGIDLDHCIKGGIISDFARRIIARMNSYAEISPSGEGIRVFFWGKLPPGGRKKQEAGFECYSEGRFLTVTGNHIAGTPLTVCERTAEFAPIHREIFGEEKPKEPRKAAEPNNLDDSALIEKARKASNGARFDYLWSGNVQGYGSQSEADLALCSNLAFWTGGDTVRIDRLFRASGLMRDKWDEKHSGGGATYGEMTIEKSLQGVNYYNPIPHSNGKAHALPPEPEYPDDWELTQEEPQEEIFTPPAAQETARPAAERFKLHRAAEALLPQPPIDWLIKGLVEAGGVYAFCGDGGSGKTYMLIDYAVTAASGASYWLDFPIQPVPVLIIDEESGETRLNRRLGYVMRGHRVERDIPLYYVTLARFDIRNPEDINALLLLIEQTGARIVIVDALIDVIPGAEENSSKEIQPGMMALGRLAKTKACGIVLIHHTNKQGGYRGTSAIKDNVDGMYTVEKRSDSSVVEVGTEKTRDTGAVRFTTIAHFLTDPAGELESVIFNAADPRPTEAHFSKAENFVMRYLAEHKQAEMTAIMAAADTCTDQGARQAVYKLTERGYTRRVDTGGSGMKATYGLTEKGSEAA